MDKFYVNKSNYGNPNNDHEVHRESCKWLPAASNRIYLGVFSRSADAVKAAKLYYSKVDGCYHCCPESHHG